MLNRDYRIELLAAAPGQDLLSLADRVLRRSEPPTVIAGPEVGLVMMQTLAVLQYGTVSAVIIANLCHRDDRRVHRHKNPARTPVS